MNNKELKLYMNINGSDSLLGHRNGRWSSVPFTHP
uniref:Uncharacterized protein n=1 Tax=Rhizophora mucronata TaxID=61149 RepID=A0A2P2QT52_RHIMU